MAPRLRAHPGGAAGSHAPRRRQDYGRGDLGCAAVVPGEVPGTPRPGCTRDFPALTPTYSKVSLLRWVVAVQRCTLPRASSRAPTNADAQVLPTAVVAFLL